MSPVRNARLVVEVPRGARRIQPKNPFVWIRVMDEWVSGTVRHWLVKDDMWWAWVQYQRPGTDYEQYPAWGMFAYDKDAIRSRARAGEDPPEG